MTSPRSFSFPQSQVWSGKLGFGMRPKIANTPPSTEKSPNHVSRSPWPNPSASPDSGGCMTRVAPSGMFYGITYFRSWASRHGTSHGARRELFVTNISRYSVRSHPLQPTMQFGLSSRDTTMKNGVAAARVAFELVKLQRPDLAGVCSRSLRGRDRQAEPILNKFHSSKWSELHFSWTLPIRAHSNQKCPGA